MRSNPAFDQWIPTLASILLIETYNRPRLVRTLEWAVSILFWHRKMTLGPYQLTNSPWRFDKATLRTIQELTNFGCTPLSQRDGFDNIATCWNGSSARQPGSAIGYSHALRLAYAHIITRVL